MLAGAGGGGKAHGAGLYYEASVAGGIPIIRTLHCSMQANRINKVMGIINGTTNYILSAMTQEEKLQGGVGGSTAHRGLRSRIRRWMEGLDAKRTSFPACKHSSFIPRRAGGHGIS